MKSLSTRLQLVNMIFLILFAIGCWIILVIFIPAWKQLDPKEFLDWFSLYGKTIGAVMLPLELIPVILSMICYVGTENLPQPARTLFYLVNVANVFSLFLFPVYFLPVNRMFLAGTIEYAQVSSVLDEWDVFHTVRTMLATSAAATSVIIAFSLRPSRTGACFPGSRTSWSFLSKQAM